MKEKIKRLFASIAAILMAIGLVGANAVPVRAANDLTITVQNAQSGQTYTLYKLFDATVNSDRASKTDNSVDSEVLDNGINYTIPAGKSLETTSWTIGGNTVNTSAGTTWFQTDAAGNVKKVNDDINLTTQEFQNWAKAFGTQIGEPVTASGSEVKITGLTDGYYFVTSTMGSLLTVTSIAPNAIIKDKNTAPDVAKTEDVKTSNNGDEITYTVEISLPKGSSNVIFHDRLGEGLVLQGSAPATITTGSKTGTTLDNGSYTVDHWNATKSNTTGKTNGDNITLSFNSTYLSGLTEQTTVFLTYTAKLNGQYINAPNEAYVTYGDQNTESAKKTVYESSFFFTVNKLDGDDNNKPLPGAKFVLSTKGDLGTLTENDLASHSSDLIKFNSNGLYDTSGNYLIEANGGTNNNVLSLSGLNNDNTDTITYYLYEVTAPDGYNKLTAPVEIQIIPTFAADDTVSHGTHVESYKVNYKMPGDTEWTAAVDNEGKEAIGNNVAHNVNITNHKGSLLPSTGGIGTTIFYVAGGILIIGAAVLLVARRKRNA